jgi:glycine/sarcosine N-methyltransferase
MSFYQVLSQYYDLLFPANPNQINFIEKYSQPATRILDIAAGTGNQAILLAKKGYDITAIDSSEEMISKMEEKADEEQVSLQCVNLAMEKIQELAITAYDSIICIGNSIVHLNSIEDIRQMITDIYKLLESDGTFIVQIVNYDRILEQQIKELPLIKKDGGISFQRTYEFSQEKVLFHGVLSVEHEGLITQFENTVELFPLQSFELVSVLQEAGFSEITLFGDFMENEFTISSPAIIAVAKK